MRRGLKNQDVVKPESGQQRVEGVADGVGLAQLVFSACLLAPGASDVI